MATQHSRSSSTVTVDRDGEDLIVTVMPPRPSKKLNLEFLGDEAPYIVTVEAPLLPRKEFNWSRSDGSNKHQSSLSPAGRGGVRRCEVLASLKPQEHYTLRVSQPSERTTRPINLTHLYLSFSDDSGQNFPLGFIGLST